MQSSSGVITIVVMTLFCDTSVSLAGDANKMFLFQLDAIQRVLKLIPREVSALHRNACLILGSMSKCRKLDQVIHIHDSLAFLLTDICVDLPKYHMKLSMLVKSPSLGLSGSSLGRGIPVVALGP